jgi:hypothetical protein
MRTFFIAFAAMALSTAQAANQSVQADNGDAYTSWSPICVTDPL